MRDARHFSIFFIAALVFTLPWFAFAQDDLVTLPSGSARVKYPLSWEATEAATESAAEAATSAIQLQPSLIWSVKLHEGSLSDVAFSPDGTMVAAVGVRSYRPITDDLTLFDATSGNPIHLFTPPGGITRLAFSPDGKTLASASSEGVVGLWDVETGTEKLSVEKGAQVKQLAFSPTGDSLAYITDPPSATVWMLDIASGQDRSLTTLADSGTGLAFSPDDSSLLVSGNGIDKLAGHAITSLWDLATNQATKTINPEGWPLDVFFATGGKPLAVTTDQYNTNQVTVWDVASDTILYTLPAATSADGSATTATTRVEINPAGTILATVAINSEVRLWDALTGVALGTLNRGSQATPSDPIGVAFSRDGSRAVVGSAYGGVALFQLGGNAPTTPSLASVPAEPTATEPGSSPVVSPTTPTTEANTSTGITCTITPPQMVNLRSGPGTSFARAGSLNAGQTATINGQAQGSDGKTWYRSTDSTWVRGDVAHAPPECASVPTVTP